MKTNTAHFDNKDRALHLLACFMHLIKTEDVGFMRQRSVKLSKYDISYMAF